MSTTSAPSWAATSAASYPPGPPPITTTVATQPLLPVRGTFGSSRWLRLLAMALYAAYGPNLDPQRMASRAPTSPARGVGWLVDWRLTFGGEDLGWDGALGTVVEEPCSQVFVMLYDVPEWDEKVLDEWEGTALGVFVKIRVRVQTLEGEVTAWLYVVDGYEGGLPSAHYLGIIADAAEEAGAPDDYVADLRTRPCRNVNP